MKCLVIVLNETEKLNDLLQALGDNGIKGATIISSTGMAQQLIADDVTTRFLGSLRSVLNPDRENNYTIFMIVKDEEVMLVKAAVKKVLHDLSKPNTGIMFAVDVDFVEGVDIK